MSAVEPSGGGAEGEGGPGDQATGQGSDDHGTPDVDDIDDLLEIDDDFAPLYGSRATGGVVNFFNVAHGNINAGSVHGDQRVENTGAPGTSGPYGGRRVEAHEGPVSALEILEARAGFAEPEWFRPALAKLDTRILFLYGELGTGRRTAALNLLHRHSGYSMKLRALDGDENLSTWRPSDAEARGYLVYGLLPQHPLGPAVMANLRRLLTDADARMVIVLPHDPERIRVLSRDLHVSPVHCVPPPPRAVFDARFEAAVPDTARRERLLARMEPGALETLLPPELVPAQVAELVAVISRASDDGPDLTDLRERLSFLAEGEVPELLGELRDDPDGLAFLLAISVYEGLDHRIVREEAERLLALADGRLNSVLPESGDDDGQGRPGRRDDPRPNPRFVFRRPLEELLRAVRAQCMPREIRANTGFTYTVEPVRFTRHRQAEAVLRHAWRQYGELSKLLTEWMDSLPDRENELTEPVGRVMGMAAGWGGGRRALEHIGELARSPQPHSRTTAAFALGIAAQDPVLASEVKYLLSRWSRERGSRLRWTTAYTCGTDFGTSRPELALRLLRRSYRGADGDEASVATAVQGSLRALFAAGNQQTVFRQIAEWAVRQGPEAELSLKVFPQLLRDDPSWFQEQLVTVGEHTETVIALVRRALDDESLFDETSRSLIGWCRRAAWDEALRSALETLLTVLAQDLRLGVLRLFVVIDGDETPELAGRQISHRALEAWRRGDPQTHSSTHPHGGRDDRGE
ncbi:hypothetical protein OG500_03440 [Kitasatospora sp. NBC_01250]|uniref:hypothetical protein n=1 Tax=Kitasatospora sp. NBC_01250 TaxID=2903571 RepID=UPI002E32E85B|nr:hypothetical protein [Kitasatospora sp. NBC_01250]